MLLKCQLRYMNPKPILGFYLVLKAGLWNIALSLFAAALSGSPAECPPNCWIWGFTILGDPQNRPPQIVGFPYNKDPQ